MASFQAKIGSVRVRTECLNDKKQQNGKTTHLECMRIAQPPEFPSKHLHRVIGLVRWQRGCGRIKIVPINVSRTAKVKNTYLGCDNALQSKWRPGKQNGTISNITVECRVLGEHYCQHGRPKFKATNVSIAQEDETAYLECASTAQPHGNIPKCACRVVGPRCQHSRIRIIPRNVS